MKQTLLAIFIGLLLFSCKKDVEDFTKLKNKEFSVVNWEPTFVAPLANSETTLGEIYSDVDTLIERLEEDDNLRISVNSDNLFVLSYEDEVETGDINEYYEIPDVTESFSLTIPQQGLNNLQAGGLFIGTTFEDIWDTTFVLSAETSYNALLKEAIFDGGSISFDYSSDINQDLDITATIRSVINQNTNDTVRLNLSTLNSSDSETFVNHRVDMFSEDLIGDDRFNKFEINVKVSGTVRNSSLTGSDIELSAKISDLNISYIEGFLGQFEEEIISDVLKFDIFSDEQITGIHFRDPSITLEVENTAGLPFTATLEQVDLGYLNDEVANLGVDGDVIEVAGVTQLSDIANDNPGTETYIIDNKSQLDELLPTSPNKLIYDFRASPDIANKTDNFGFFLDKDSKVKVNILAELPADFSVLNFEYSDTVKMDGSDLGVDSVYIDYLKRAALKIVFNNQLPLEVKIQGYLLDSNSVVIDSVYSDGFETILANDNVDSDGIAQSPQEVISVSEIDKAKFENILKTKNIIYVGKASTSNASADMFNDVKILSSYTFGLKAGILAAFDVDLNSELELGETK